MRTFAIAVYDRNRLPIKEFLHQILDAAQGFAEEFDRFMHSFVVVLILLGFLHCSEEGEV